MSFIESPRRHFVPRLDGSGKLTERPPSKTAERVRKAIQLARPRFHVEVGGEVRDLSYSQAREVGETLLITPKSEGPKPVLKAHIQVSEGIGLISAQVEQEPKPDPEPELDTHGHVVFGGSENVYQFGEIERPTLRDIFPTPARA